MSRRLSLNPRRAFTLTECAALLGVATLSAAAIVPCLAGAQTNAHSAIAHANLQMLVRGQLAFANDNDLLIPGPNTSGFEAHLVNGQSLVGNTTPSTPTQNMDWISPCLGDELNLSPNRAERIWQIHEFLACPRAVRRIDTLYGGDLDDHDLEAIQETRGYLQVSYLAPGPFHLPRAWTPDGYPYAENEVLRDPGFPARSPVGYAPRIDLVGAPAGKVAAADGARYLSVGSLFGGYGTILDIYASADSSLYGNFLTGTPAFQKSVAYGRDWLPVQYDDENVRLSLRYPSAESSYGRGMHTGRFDGSVVFITAEEAWTDVSLWYPSGSEFNGVNATPEAAAVYDVGDIIP